jgi:hemoglobin
MKVVFHPVISQMTRLTLRWCLGLYCAGLALHAHGAERSSLYERLGGTNAIHSIADTLIDRVVADPRLGRSFKDTKIARIKEKLAEQLCELTGGPCQYTGDPMRETHAGHHISESEFYGMVETLRAILRERHTGITETNQLLRLLAPMKRDIVEGPDNGPIK